MKHEILETKPEIAQTPEFFSPEVDITQRIRNGLENIQDRLAINPRTALRAGAVALGSGLALNIGYATERPADREAFAQTPPPPGYVDPSPERTYDQEMQECITTAVNRAPDVGVRYVWKKDKNGVKKSSRRIKVGLADINNTPGPLDASCDQYEEKPREFEVQHEQRRIYASKSSKIKPNSAVRTVKLVDGYMIGTRVFIDKFTMRLNKPRIPRKTKARLRVKECVFPLNREPQCRTFYYK